MVWIKYVIGTEGLQKINVAYFLGYCMCEFGGCCGAEVESTSTSQSSLPTIAAQSAPSIMRKRGYEHINGVEGELNYCVIICRGIVNIA